MLQTTWPTEADAVPTAQPTAQRDTITEITCATSSEYDVERHAPEMEHRSVDGSTPRELLPQDHTCPEPTTADYATDAAATIVNTPPITHNPSSDTTTTVEICSVIADFAAVLYDSTVQVTANTIMEIMCKASSEHAVVQLAHEVARIIVDVSASLRTPDHGPPQPGPMDTTLETTPVVTNVTVNTPTHHATSLMKLRI